MPMLFSEKQVKIPLHVSRNMGKCSALGARKYFENIENNDNYIVWIQKSAKGIKNLQQRR